MPDRDRKRNSTSSSWAAGRRLRAALYGAAAGLNIAMIEEARVGGTCLHRGCIPAKELLQTAEVLRTVRNAKEFGVDAGSADARPADEPGPQAAGRRPADQGPRDAAQGAQGHRRPRAPGRSSTPPRTTCACRTAPSSPATRSSSRPGRSRGLLAGFDFDGTVVLSSDHVLDARRGARAHRDHRRRRDRLRVRVVPRRRRQRGHAARGDARDPPRRRPSRSPTVARAFKKRGITVETGVTSPGVDRGTRDTGAVPGRRGRADSSRSTRSS